MRAGSEPRLLASYEGDPSRYRVAAFMGDASDVPVLDEFVRQVTALTSVLLVLIVPVVR